MYSWELTLGTISLILSRKTGIARIMEVYLELHFAFWRSLIFQWNTKNYETGLNILSVEYGRSWP